MNYQQSLDHLNWLGHETLGVKFGLEKISRVLAALGNPHGAYPSIIIAGTNGKGSTAAMLDAVMREAGLCVGLYTSPHLVRIEERIRVNGEEISPDDFARTATRVAAVTDRLLGEREIESRMSYFEFVTAMGFEYFRRREIQIAVLEVGLGGRLDATNIAPPFASVITRVDIDHEQYLGSTIESIAAEKAAVIKPGCRAIVAEQRPEAFRVITAHCRQRDIEPVRTPSEIAVSRVEPDGRVAFEYVTEIGERLDVRLGLCGRHQVENALAVIKTVETLRSIGYRIPAEAIIEGIAAVRWPGRLEIIRGEGAPILLDGAHNMAGARVLRQYLEEFGRKPVTLIFGAMRDKRITEIAAELFPLAQTIILTRAQDERAAELSLLAEKIGQTEGMNFAENSAEAFALAERITPASGMICVTGSLYLVGEAKRWLAETKPQISQIAIDS